MLGEQQSLPTTTPGRVDFFAPGMPGTKGSGRGVPVKRAGGRMGIAVINDNPKAKAWAAVVPLAARQAMGGMPAFDGPVRVSLTFYLPRPKAHSGKKGLKPWAPRLVSKPPDLDKLARCAIDALSAGVVFLDDAQVAELDAVKVYAEGGGIGARIVVRETA